MMQRNSTEYVHFDSKPTDHSEEKKTEESKGNGQSSLFFPSTKSGWADINP